MTFFFSQNIAYTQTYETKKETLLNIAIEHYLSNQDSLYFYTEKLKKLALENNDIACLYDSYNIQSWSSSYYGDLELIRDNISILDSLTLVYKDKFNLLPDRLYYQCQFDYSKGLYAMGIKDYNTSRFYHKRIISECEKLPDSLLSDELSSFLSDSNISIGVSYREEGKSTLAKGFFLQNIRFLENKKSLAIEYNTSKLHLANIYTDEKQYDKANNIMLKSIPFYQSRNKNSHRVMVTYHRVIKNYLHMRKLDSAEFYLEKLETAIKQDKSKLHRYFDSKFLIYKSQGNYSEALKTLEDLLKLKFEKWNGKHHLEIAEVYNKIGQTHSEFNQQKKAIKNYNLALEQFSEDSINSTINQSIKFKTLKHKSNTLNQLKNYTLSLKTSDEAISILDSLKPSFKTNNDKLFLIENAFPLFENCIEAAYQLFKETNNAKYIDKAFLYSEKSKSTLLLESLLSSQATTFANIPDELVEKEKQLKAKITYLEKKINTKSSNELKDQLFDIKQDYRNLIHEIETNYKGYYDLKYNIQALSRQELQDWLDDDTTLLSYFYGSNSIYIISVTKTSAHIEQQKIDTTFETLLKDSYTLLSNPKSDLVALKTKTKDLYQKLVKKSLTKSSKEKVIIIPDGLLNYLPFGSLSVDGTNYFIQNHSISYANSATLLMQLQNKTQHNNRVLAFAPNFENSDASALLSLPNNTKEVKQVLTHFKGEAFTNEKASLKNFNGKNKDFGIIHLATHAILDDENPEYSYLAFSPNPETDNLLYTNDLYNLELNSNMVTLSACESGIGDLKRGEGMMSLARGFYFSGTSSIASTLWKVNDASSSQLMDNFYKDLSQGKAKDIALQKAKINFINTHKDNALSHPYYWSGFIISGNTNALTSNSQWLYVVLGLLILIGFGLILRRKKQTA